MGLLVFDGFRPLGVQRYLYDHFRAEVAAASPGASDEEIALLVGKFVASPSADPRCPPPHRTGGAVDVCLVESASGFELLMGTAPDEVAPESATRYFEEFPQEPFTTNRRLLFHAMTGAGFTSYEGEWWHFDYGNQRWANCAHAPAPSTAPPPSRRKEKTMYVVCVTIKVLPGRSEAFLEARRNHLGTRQEPGNVRFDVLRLATAPAEGEPEGFFLYEVYRSPEDFAAHQQTPHYLAWRDAVALMAEPRQGVRYQSIFPDPWE